MNKLTDISVQEPKGEIVLYQPDETIRLEVRMEDDTVWSYGHGTHRESETKLNQ